MTEPSKIEMSEALAAFEDMPGEDFLSDYFHDLNAMARIEKLLNEERELMGDYLAWIIELLPFGVRPNYTSPLWPFEMFMILTAPAPVRARAAYETIKDLDNVDRS